MRLWVRASEIDCFSVFPGQWASHWIPYNARNLSTLYSLPPHNVIPGMKGVEKNRKRFPGMPYVSPSHTTVANTNSQIGIGMLSNLPFSGNANT